MIRVGDRLPEVSFRVKADDGSVVLVTSRDVFAGRTILLVGVPGAFTPTCHEAHIPGFVRGADAIKGRGVDAVAVVAVNDCHVMRAWAESLGVAGEVEFLADGSATFVRATGLAIDMIGEGLGIRLRRFGMIVDDGVVRVLNLEPDSSEVTVSGADAMTEAG